MQNYFENLTGENKNTNDSSSSLEKYIMDQSASSQSIPPIISDNLAVITRIANQAHLLSPNNSPGAILAEYTKTVSTIGQDIYNGNDNIKLLDLILTLYFSHHPNQFTLNQTKNTENQGNIYAMEQKNSSVIWKTMTQDPTQIIEEFISQLSIPFITESLSNKDLLSMKTSTASSNGIINTNTATSTTSIIKSIESASSSLDPNKNTSINKNTKSLNMEDETDTSKNFILKEESEDNIIRPINVKDDLDDLNMMTQVDDKLTSTTTSNTKKSKSTMDNTGSAKKETKNKKSSKHKKEKSPKNKKERSSKNKKEKSTKKTKTEQADK